MGIEVYAFPKKADKGFRDTGQVSMATSLAEKPGTVAKVSSLGIVSVVQIPIPAGHFPNNDNPSDHRDSVYLIF